MLEWMDIPLGCQNMDRIISGRKSLAALYNISIIESKNRQAKTTLQVLKFFYLKGQNGRHRIKRTSRLPPGFAGGGLLVFARRGLRYIVLQIPSFVVIY